ncbi:MAG: hypothetical protein WBW38_19335 [Candidatus Sulfotelmatobacter sp.]
MERSLIWIEGDAAGWSCSNCGWRFAAPTLLSGEEEAMAAYDRLAAAKFREHQCAAEVSIPAANKKPDTGSAFANRARILIMRGFKPKDAVELVLHEVATESGGNAKLIEKARVDAEEFLSKIRQGLI